jgi:DNA polymerase-3 subunit delta'
MTNNHPDIITVTDPDHKAVAVKIVREYREDVYIKPNEADKKVYIFPQELGTEGQNALLKILEEPPSYGVFLLLTDNPERLLPTVRSRCTELALQSVPEMILRRDLQQRFPDVSPDTLSAVISRSGGYLGQALKLLEGTDELPMQTVDFARAFAGRDVMGLVRVLVPMEKWKRDQLIPVLQQWLSILEESLACRAGGRAVSELARTISASRSSADLLSAIRQLQKCTEYAQGNISPAAICGYLQWALR